MWTPGELTAIANADELQLAPRRDDGQLRKPVTIWVVRDGDGGVDKDVAFDDAIVAPGARATTLRLVPR